MAEMSELDEDHALAMALQMSLDMEMEEETRAAAGARRGGRAGRGGRGGRGGGATAPGLINFRFAPIRQEPSEPAPSHASTAARRRDGAPRLERGGGGGRGGGRGGAERGGGGRGGRRAAAEVDVAAYGRGQYVHAHAHAVLDARSLPARELELLCASADRVAPWESVRRVRLLCSEAEPPACPICLADEPSCAQVTQCGHVFCLPCITRHLDEADNKLATAAASGASGGGGSHGGGSGGGGHSHGGAHALPAHAGPRCPICAEPLCDELLRSVTIDLVRTVVPAAAAPRPARLDAKAAAAAGAAAAADGRDGGATAADGGGGCPLAADASPGGGEAEPQRNVVRFVKLWRRTLPALSDVPLRQPALDAALADASERTRAPRPPHGWAHGDALYARLSLVHDLGPLAHDEARALAAAEAAAAADGDGGTLAYCALARGSLARRYARWHGGAGAALWEAAVEAAAAEEAERQARAARGAALAGGAWPELGGGGGGGGSGGGGGGGGAKRSVDRLAQPALPSSAAPAIAPPHDALPPRAPPQQQQQPQPPPRVPAASRALQLPPRELSADADDSAGAAAAPAKQAGDAPPSASAPPALAEWRCAYQAADGQRLFLAPLDARCLAAHYGGWAALPAELALPVARVEAMALTDDGRRRQRASVAHLPLRAVVGMCELDETSLLEALAPAARALCAAELGRRAELRARERAERAARERAADAAARSARAAAQSAAACEPGCGALDGFVTEAVTLSVTAEWSSAWDSTLARARGPSLAEVVAKGFSATGPDLATAARAGPRPGLAADARANGGRAGDEGARAPQGVWAAGGGRGATAAIAIPARALGAAASSAGGMSASPPAAPAAFAAGAWSAAVAARSPP